MNYKTKLELFSCVLTVLLLTQGVVGLRCPGRSMYHGYATMCETDSDLASIDELQRCLFLAHNEMPQYCNTDDQCTSINVQIASGTFSDTDDKIWSFLGCYEQTKEVTICSTTPVTTTTEATTTVVTSTIAASTTTAAGDDTTTAGPDTTTPAAAPTTTTTAAPTTIVDTTTVMTTSADTASTTTGAPTTTVTTDLTTTDLTTTEAPTTSTSDPATTSTSDPPTTSTSDPPTTSTSDAPTTSMSTTSAAPTTSQGSTTTDMTTSAEATSTEAPTTSTEAPSTSAADDSSTTSMAASTTADESTTMAATTTPGETLPEFDGCFNATLDFSSATCADNLAMITVEAMYYNGSDTGFPIMIKAQVVGCCNTRDCLVDDGVTRDYVCNLGVGSDTVSVDCDIGCFTYLSTDGSTTTAQHGCLESLSLDDTPFEDVTTCSSTYSEGSCHDINGGDQEVCMRCCTSDNCNNWNSKTGLLTPATTTPSSASAFSVSLSTLLIAALLATFNKL